MNLGNSWQALLENPLGSLLVLLIALFVPLVIYVLLIWHAPRSPSYGRLSSGVCLGLGAGACLLLCAAWLLPSQVLGRDPHQVEVAGLSISGAVALGALTWYARFPHAGGFSAALGALLAVTLVFWFVAVVPDSTGQSGVGLFILVFLGSLGLGLVALIAAAIRVRLPRRV
ncbi:hypothetical protein [Corynebacterium sp. A21]|uniref:hypothetical protein n=1 Tax=Corynebacterium sp. A21 TaxID=3457318 RepID=UPI003FD36CDF